MIAESDIAQQLRDLLDSEVDARCENGRLRILTPFEYPDGDGVVVLVEQSPDGRFVVSDGGAAGATLLGQIGTRAIASPATGIAQRFGIAFEAGEFTTTVESGADIADACQRIARAAAGVTEAAAYMRRSRPKETEFVDVITNKFHQRDIEVEAGRTLDGASGHSYTATLFVPDTETVIEPIGGERHWAIATAVYVEFGDLKEANGYRLMAILDDRKADLGPDVSNLLGQVADVAYWRQHNSWIAEVAAR